MASMVNFTAVIVYPDNEEAPGDSSIYSGMVDYKKLQEFVMWCQRNGISSAQ